MYVINKWKKAYNFKNIWAPNAIRSIDTSDKKWLSENHIITSFVLSSKLDQI